MLLGDAGVGKSVMAGVLSQRMRRAGNLGAAYFCRHNDDTRNNPRYLLGTIAYQLCKCNSQYSSKVGREVGVRTLLAKSKLGVQELFTKLLLEPLNMCSPCDKRKLVVIDALDETEYESREDFLNLIMHCFPLLPQWLVFFITSRPEDTVQFRLKKYNPCIKLCAGNSENLNFYQQHEQDIKLFLEKSVDFSRLPYSVEDIAKKCNGLFLYAFYIARFFKDQAPSGKIGQLTDLFPGDIEDFFLQNFKRIFDKVGADLYKKLFGCAIIAPSPLPVSFISFILQREKSDLEEQEVIDAVSTFVVLRTSDKTFAFLHNLIPTWLTDKEKASRKLFVDRIKAGEYFWNIVVTFLPVFFDEQSKGRPLIDSDILDYVLRVGVRFLCGFSDKVSLETICSCLTSYEFIQSRIQNRKMEIYSLIEDFKLAAECQVCVARKKQVLEEICAVLESNIFVLSECPNLLHSCLRSTCKAVQNIGLPGGISTTWMECSWLPYPDSEILHGIRCFALSPDEKLLAGGKGKHIFLFDASTLEKVQGVSYVIEMEDEIHHLEFSPDGNFLFFGKLDKWFSVEQGCVMEFPQFAENCSLYKWSSFTSDGRYIVVKGDPHGTGEHELSCLVNIFFIWAAQELDHMQGSDKASCCDHTILWLAPLRSEQYKPRAVQDLLGILKRKKVTDWCSDCKHFYTGFCQGLYGVGGREVLSESLCPKCDKFEKSYRQKTLALVRQRVLELYSEIFEYQMWDVKSGKPVLEKAFSPGVKLSPFFFLCHLITPLEWKETLCYIDKATSLYSVALFNALYNLSKDRREYNFKCWLPLSSKLEPEAVAEDLLKLRQIPSFESICNHAVAPFSFFVANAPVEFQNHLFFTREVRMSLALDRTWMAIREHGKKSLYLFKVGEGLSDQLKHFTVEESFHVTENVEHFAFTEDSSVFLYYTDEKSLQAILLQTGTKLSASKPIPFFHPLKKQGEYFVLAKEEGISRFLNDLPRSLCGLIIFQSCKTSLEATFISVASILGLLPEVWKTTGDKEDVNSFANVKNFEFSQDGNLIAIHQGTKISMFDCCKFLYSLCSDQREYDVSYLAFSPDSTLLLYCIQNSIDNPHFYVWDVQNRHFSASFDLTRESLLLSVDCCCFSSDNQKLVICGELMIEIWEYVEGTCHLITRVDTTSNVFYSEVFQFTYCTVSPKNNLLACCIADRIVLRPLNTPTDQFIRPLPRAHLGKIEFCRFLKGNRYLISYGVDGTVFLWDLTEWRAIAFAKMAQGRESIVSLCVSHEEDKVVCLTFDGRLSVLNLCGLEHSMLSTLPLAEVKSTVKTTQEARGSLGEHHGLTAQDVQYFDRKDVCDDLDVDTLIEEMNLMCQDDSEDSDYGDDADVQERL